VTGQYPAAQADRGPAGAPSRTPPAAAGPRQSLAAAAEREDGATLRQAESQVDSEPAGYGAPMASRLRGMALRGKPELRAAWAIQIPPGPDSESEFITRSPGP
jgi:hypothetical protein